jgi:hypothetical protein
MLMPTRKSRTGTAPSGVEIKVEPERQINGHVKLEGVFDVTSTNPFS